MQCLEHNVSSVGFMVFKQSVVKLSVIFAPLLFTTIGCAGFWMSFQGVERTDQPPRIYKFYPIIEASEKGDVEKVRQLISMPSSEHWQIIRDEDKDTALHKACYHGHLAVVKLLIEKRALLNLQNNKGLTPLDIAIHSGHFRIATELIGAGAEINLKDRKGRGLAHNAAYWDNPAFMQQLILNKKVPACSHGWCPLHIASALGYVKVVQVLLAAKSNVNSVDVASGWTPLHVAAATGRSTVVELLLTFGANPKKRATSGNLTPSGMAMKRGHVRIAKALIAWEDKDFILADSLLAKPPQQRKSRCVACPPKRIVTGTPISKAIAEKNKEELVRNLIVSNNHLNTLNSDGRTPLMYATKHACQLPIVQILLRFSPNLDYVGDNDGTALHVAASTGCDRIAKLLLSANADVRASDKHGRSSLFFAVHFYHYKLVDLLILSKGNIHQREGRSKSTLLHVAASRIWKYKTGIIIRMIKLLLRHGADPNAQDIKGRTPLHIAVLSSQADRPIAEVIARVLVMHKTDVTKKDKDGNTALDLAKKRKNKRAVAFLENVTGSR